MKSFSIIPFFLLSFFLSEAGICVDYPIGEKHPVALCLKELDVVKKDFEKRRAIKKRCLELAESIFKKDKTITNQKFLLDAAMDYSYSVEQSQNKYFTDVYNKYFSTFKLDGVEGKDLDYLFESYQTLVFYLPWEILAERLEEIYNKINKARITTKEEKEKVLGALIFNRMWDEVEKFQRKSKIVPLDSPTLFNLKSLRDQIFVSGPKFYEFSPNGDLIVKNYKPKEEFSVVVVSSSECGFSSWAMREIGEDKDLRDFFNKYGIFITSQTGLFELKETFNWNIQNPATSLKLVYFESEWPSQIDWAGTPTFVFFKGNKYSHQFSGWDKDQVSKSIQWLKEGKGEFKF